MQNFFNAVEKRRYPLRGLEIRGLNCPFINFINLKTEDMAAAFFRGTQIDQNVKFKDKDRQLIRETEWPAEFEQPVDLSKVSRQHSIPSFDSKIHFALHTFARGCLHGEKIILHLETTLA